jgi:hypothetical protein
MRCTVRFHDPESTIHEFDVDDETLYEGVAKALLLIRQQPWSDTGLEYGLSRGRD